MAAVTSGSTLLFGNASVASVADSDSAGVAEAFSFAAKATGTLQTLKLYVDSGNMAKSIHIGVYSGTSKPGSLLGECVLSSPTAAAWNSCTVTSAPSIVSGTTYWVAVMDPAAQVSFRDENGGTAYESASGSLTDLPNPYVAGTSWASSKLSVQALGVLAGSADAGSTPPDAGAVDAGAPDAGAPVAGAADAGSAPDAGPADAGAPDAGGQSTYPDATNTGVPPGTTLTAKTASSCWVISTDGTVVNAVDLSGCIDVEANNVTIQNSRISSNTWWAIKYGASSPNVTGLKILHNTILSVAGRGPDNGGYDYAISQQASGTIEVGYNNISGYKDGVDIVNGSVHDNYIHDLSYFSGAHTQDIYVWSGGPSVTITHNRLINQTPSDYATAAVYIAPDSPNQKNVTVQDNWLAGGALTLYGGDTNATYIHVIDNLFSTEIFPNAGYYGTDGYWFGSNTGNIWSGNKWANGPKAGTLIDP